MTADSTSFQSAAASAEQALKQLPSNASAAQVSQQVQPLLAAANSYQSQVINFPWSASAKPAIQSLLNSVGRVSAVLDQAIRGAGFTSVSEFKSELKSAVASVKSAASSVPTTG